MPEAARYRILEPLGEGGMGRVLLAFDTVLRRQVALKFIREDDPRQAERLLLEARLQAGLDHDHIVKVYEVGHLKGRPFIAMQAVLGDPLESAGASLPVEERVRLLALVARAVHAAHQQGLVHRDLKPANILVERQTDGSLKPYVLDFGLARGPKSTGLSTGGVPAGTLHYMAPEQLSGEAVPDPCSDVYSLGATLYAVLGGEPPFGGSGAEHRSALLSGLHRVLGDSGEAQASLLRRVMEEEALPLRRRVPELPKDLETVAARCLEKDPSRRYASALALAEDLDRFLAGDPIAACPLGPLGRTLRWTRRHRAVALTFAGAAAALLALQLWSVRSAWLAANAAVRLGGEANEMESAMRMASLLPRHDLRADMDKVRARMDLVREEARRAGRRADGPGAYALGRGHLALREYDPARAELEKAWSMGYRTPDVALSLGLAEGQLYQARRDEIASIADPAAREAALTEARRQFRDPALDCLRQALASGAEQRDYLEALIAYQEERFEDAVRAARKAAEASPGLYEARRLEGDALMAQARGLVMRGDQPGSVPLLEAAGQAYAKGLAMGRSDAGLYRAEALRCYYLAFDRLALHGDPDPPLARGLEAVDQALEVDPGDALACEAGVYLNLEAADAAARRGRDGLAELERAQSFAERAVTQSPGDHKAWEALGAACGARVDQLALKGQPVDALVDKGVSALEWALKLAPASANAHYTLSAMRMEKADLGTRRGEDPRPMLRQAVGHAREAVKLGGNRPLAVFLEAEAWQAIATYELDQSEPAQEARAEADRTYAEAQAISPGGLVFQAQRADWLGLLALRLEAGGLDGTPTAAEATRVAQDLQRRDPVNPLARRALLRARAAGALHGAQPAQARRALAPLLAEVEGLRRHAPGDGGWGELEAEMLERDAELGLAAGASPLKSIARARARLTALLGLPKDADAHLALARCLLLEARWRALHRQALGDLPARAEGLLQQAPALQGRPETAAVRLAFRALAGEAGAREQLRGLLKDHAMLARRFGPLAG